MATAAEEPDRRLAAPLHDRDPLGGGRGRLPGQAARRRSLQPTIHLYSDVPAIAIHEGGHAKDFARREWPGLYAVAFGLPITVLYPEAIATGDALAYAERHDEEALVTEGHRILYPAYGTYIGGAAGQAVGMTIGLPIYAGAVVAGHVAGRLPTEDVSEDASEDAGD